MDRIGLPHIGTNCSFQIKCYGEPSGKNKSIIFNALLIIQHKNTQNEILNIMMIIGQLGSPEVSM